MTPEIRKHCKDCIKWLLLFKYCWDKCSPPHSDWYNLNVTSFHLKELQVYKLLCAEPYEMKTNEVQKVSEHLKKKFHFSFPSGNYQNWEGGRALHFFPQDPFEIFCYCEFALKSPQRVCSQMFSHTPFGTDPREFSHQPSPWSLPWHRLMQGMNPISRMGLSCSKSYLLPQLSGSGGLCLLALWAGLCGGSNGSWFHPCHCLFNLLPQVPRVCISVPVAIPSFLACYLGSHPL